MTTLKVILAAALGALAATVLLTGFPRLEAHVVLVPFLSALSGAVLGSLVPLGIIAYLIRELTKQLPDPPKAKAPCSMEDAFRNAPNTVEAPHV